MVSDDVACLVVIFSGHCTTDRKGGEERMSRPARGVHAISILIPAFGLPMLICCFKFVAELGDNSRCTTPSLVKSWENIFFTGHAGHTMEATNTSSSKFLQSNPKKNWVCELPNVKLKDHGWSPGLMYDPPSTSLQIHYISDAQACVWNIDAWERYRSRNLQIPLGAPRMRQGALPCKPRECGSEADISLSGWVRMQEAMCGMTNPITWLCVIRYILLYLLNSQHVGWRHS